MHSISSSHMHGWTHMLRNTDIMAKDNQISLFEISKVDHMQIIP